MTLEPLAPALLFPAVSLFMVAFNNRFAGIAELSHKIIDDHHRNGDPRLLLQVSRLRRRLSLIRSMQFISFGSLFAGVVSLVLLFNGQDHLAWKVFSASLLLLVLVMVVCVAELLMSADIVVQRAGNHRSRTP